jgi:hypothetical protein
VEALTGCERCGKPRERAKTGRPPKWCGDACKVAACRDRKRQRDETPELDPLVALAFSPEPYRWFQVGENGTSRLVGVPWLELHLAKLGYDVSDGSPLETLKLKLPPGPRRGEVPA